MYIFILFTTVGKEMRQAEIIKRENLVETVIKVLP